MVFHREQLPTPLPAEPLDLVSRWLREAQTANIQPNPNSMVLATAAADGTPSARVVLCKEIRPQPGYVTFFTNYESRKSRELQDNPRAAAVIHWDVLRRQVRLQGRVIRTTEAESDAYFASRAWPSRLGAWASQQSEPIGSRRELEQALEDTARRFAAPSPLTSDASAPDPGVLIPRPTHWGGYQMWIEAVELWVEGSARLHDRARWQRELQPSAGGFTTSPWRVTRLQP